MSATTKRKPRRKYPKKPYQPNQSIISAKVEPKLLADLREAVRVVNEHGFVNKYGYEFTASAAVREAVEIWLANLELAQVKAEEVNDEERKVEVP